MSVIEREQEIVEATKVRSPVEVRPVTKRDVLHRAGDLIEEFGHCKDSLARDADGKPFLMEPIEDLLKARWQSFCVVGAVCRAGIELGKRDVEVPGGPYWNNRPERTAAEVVARLRAAAETT